MFVSVRMTVELGTVSTSTRQAFVHPSRNDGMMDWYIQPPY